MNLKCTQCEASITRNDDVCPRCHGRTLVNEAPECPEDEDFYGEGYGDQYTEESKESQEATPIVTSSIKSDKTPCEKCHYRLEVGESPCPICGIATIYARINPMLPILSLAKDNPEPLSPIAVKDYSKRKYYTAPYFAKPGEVGDLFGYSNFIKGNPIEADYALIDLETSGLKAKDSHIIEIAVIRINRKGEVVSQFTTLINPPNGEVGMTNLHLINKVDIIGAPTFAEVAGDILESLDNAIVVAHNAKFEESFLAAEFKRMGLLDLPHIPSIDTMYLSQMAFDMPHHKLADVLSHYGYPYENAHTALGDVVSMARFLPQLLDELPEQLFPIEFTRLPKRALANSLKPR